MNLNSPYCFRFVIQYGDGSVIEKTKIYEKEPSKKQLDMDALEWFKMAMNVKDLYWEQDIED
jgi:hypothetical protein